MDSDELVERCRAGNRDAFRLLFHRHRGDVARLVHRMVGPRSDLDDSVQEVFLQVHRSLRDFRSQARFSTWLHRVTVNVVLMHRRAAKSRPVLGDPPNDDTEPASGPAPDEDAARRERIRAFERVLGRLAEKKRTVYVLHEMEGLSPAEIGVISSARPLLTVRTRLFYARRELARMLQDEPALASLQEASLDPRDGDPQ